jgi:uncharacterized coiled-coil DUF342 family protein
MILTDEERLRCHQCLEKLNQTKVLCLQSIEYLLEQQSEIDECIADLKATQQHAREINEKITQLNDFSWWKFFSCFSSRKQHSLTYSNDQNQLLILPFPPEQVNLPYSNLGFNELKKNVDLDSFFQSIDQSLSSFVTKEEFETILHEEYTALFQLAKELTKSVQIIHDTIEFLGADVTSTLNHMQSARPRMQRLLKIKAPFAFAQVQRDLVI